MMTGIRVSTRTINGRYGRYPPKGSNRIYNKEKPATTFRIFRNKFLWEMPFSFFIKMKLLTMKINNNGNAGFYSKVPEQNHAEVIDNVRIKTPYRCFRY